MIDWSEEALESEELAGDNLMLNIVNNLNEELQQQREQDEQLFQLQRGHFSRRSFSMNDIRCNLQQTSRFAAESCLNANRFELQTIFSNEDNSQFMFGNWFSSLFGCFKSIFGVISSSGYNGEIPYRQLRSWKFLGSGAHGSVFVGNVHVLSFLQVN